MRRIAPFRNPPAPLQDAQAGNGRKIVVQEWIERHLRRRGQFLKGFEDLLVVPVNLHSLPDFENFSLGIDQES